MKIKIRLWSLGLWMCILGAPLSITFGQSDTENPETVLINIRVGMTKNEFTQYYPKVSARTYRRTETEEWLTFDYPLEGDRKDLLTFHLKEDKLVGWMWNDREEVAEEYLSEFCPPGIKNDSPKIYRAIKDALSKIPQNVFLVVTDRARPVVFTAYHYVGIGRFANSSDIFVLEDDAPTFMEGFTIMKLSFELELADSSDQIEGIILHELAHKYLDHAKKRGDICAQERETNRLVKAWGFKEQFLKAKARFGHREGENKICE